MKKRAILLACILLAALCLTFTACASAQSTQNEAEDTSQATESAAEATAEEASDSADGASLRSSSLKNSLLGKVRSEITEAEEQAAWEEMGSGLKARAAENEPEVKTVNGVEVQRTPTEYKIETTAQVPGGTLSYNNYYLDSDSRGCNACHDSLADTLDAMDYNHNPLTSALGVEVTYHMCTYCHTYCSNMATKVPLRDVIHGVHVGNDDFQEAGGTCLSCHYIEADGSYSMWDDVKYSHLWGITSVDAENQTGEFTYTQGESFGHGTTFTFKWYLDQWLEGYEYTYHRFQDDYLGLSVDTGVYDTWEFTVKGCVETETTWTLAEMIDQFPSETFTGKWICAYNPSGGPLVTNVEMTGIDITYLLEAAGLTDEATGFQAISPDNYTEDVGFDYLQEGHKTYIVYQIDGEPLSILEGFPCISYVQGMPGDHCQKECIGINVDNQDSYMLEMNYAINIRGKGDIKITQPNAGFFNLLDGQCFTVGEEIELTGWADNFMYGIQALEISFDNGKTWKQLDTTGAQTHDLIVWHYTFTPDTPTAYAVTVRAIDYDGDATPVPVTKLINIKA